MLIMVRDQAQECQLCSTTRWFVDMVMICSQYTPSINPSLFRYDGVLEWVSFQLI